MEHRVLRGTKGTKLICFFFLRTLLLLQLLILSIGFRQLRIRRHRDGLHGDRRRVRRMGAVKGAIALKIVIYILLYIYTGDRLVHFIG